MGNPSPTFWIGKLAIFGDLILAPMDGITDLPFRMITRQLGSAISYSEFINAIDVVNGHPFLSERLRFEEDERPIVYQLFDDDTERLVQAASLLMEYKPNILDINMGCPTKSVSGRGAGAGLLKHPEKIRAIVKSLVARFDVPISAKIRLGWDDSNRNYLDVARLIEDSGASMIAVHGRTRSQGYGGLADWDAIAQIKKFVRIPVIGNGDVRTVRDINRIKDHTGCDAVMIGRAAIENPWIFSRTDREDVSSEQVRGTILQHLDLNLRIHGDRGIILFRKFLKGYLKPYLYESCYAKDLLTCVDPQTLIELISHVLKTPPKYH